MPTYKTPDVYIEEISTFPPSVAEVETAIPAFIGYTEKKTQKGKTLINEAKRVKSMLQFVEIFGGAPDPDNIEVQLSDQNSVEEVTIEPQYFLYDSLRMFFANGGGDCYVISVGKYGDEIQLGKTETPDANPGLLTGLASVEKIDEPTILLFPDAVLLADDVKLGDLHKAALAQCSKLQDRFAVLDVYKGDKKRSYDDADVITRFRNNTGMQSLKYGAAYYPWVQSSLDYKVAYPNVSLVKGTGGAKTPVGLSSISSDPAIVESLDAAFSDLNEINNLLNDPSFTSADTSLVKGYSDIAIENNKTEMENRASFIDDLLSEFLRLEANLSNTEILSAFDSLTKVTPEKPEPTFKTFANRLKAYDLGYPTSALAQVTDANYPDPDYDMGSVSGEDIYSLAGGGGTAADRANNGRAKFRELFDKIVNELQNFVEEAKEARDAALEIVKDTNTIYQDVLDAINKEALTLPPSGAIAGIYATVDNNRGVWKAPANVSLTNVIGPAIPITSEDQENLNVDAKAGKSVNAIRQFTGKGTMVWGARTLAGNSNEWRYIPVRRFFNMVEESVKKSTYWAVFEPNDANTWVKVRTMIENYLTQKWREGALAGAKPDQAFFVRVGLGQTMTQQDILEARMNVEIGMAAVRPAEFIILKFSHKMQEV